MFKPATFSLLAMLLMLVVLALVAIPSRAVDAGQAPAALAATTTDAEREKILDAVDHLGSADPSERETASKFLSSVARQAEPILADAVKGDDAEVAARRRILLRRIHAGVNADTPKEIVDRVAEYEEAGDADGKLAAAGKLVQIPEAVPILVRLWASEPNGAIRTQVGQLFRGQARKFIPQLVAADADDAILTLLANDAALGDLQTQDYVTALLLTHKLDDAVKQLGPPENVASRPAGWLYLAKGEPDVARQIAERTKDDRLLRTIQYFTGDWKSLAAFFDGLSNGDKPPEDPLFLSAAFHSMDRDEKALDADLQRITRFTRDKPGNAFSAAEVFLLVGRIDDAIAMLKDENPSVAFELLCEQMRFPEALALLEKPPQEALARFSLNAAAAHWYHRLGRDEDAAAALSAAEKAAAEQPEPRVRPGAIAGIAWALGLKERAVAIVDKAVDPRMASNIIGDLFVARHSEAEIFWPVLLKAKPDATTAEHLTAMEDLLSGRTAEKEVRVLADMARKQAMQIGPADSSRQMVWVARLLTEYSISDAAESCLQRVPAQAAAADGYLTLGDVAAKEKRWPDAVRLYGTASDLSGGAPIAMYLQGWALAKSGSADEGAPLIRRARLLPLAGEERGNLTRGLLQRKLHAEADEESQLMLKVSDFASRSASEAAQRRAKMLADKGDFAGALDLLQRGMLMVFQRAGTYLSESAYLDAPRSRDEFRARGLIAAGKVDEAAPLLRRAAERFASDVDWTIRVVQLLEKTPETKALADELFTTSFERHRALLETYPKASSFHNGLAWLCARTGRQLDEALKHADQAVASDPNNSAYLDTLAETHFRRGENAKAIDLAKKCVELSPRSDYFKSNIKRFAGEKTTVEPDADDNGDSEETD